MGNNDRGLYLHIPFCPNRCPYCDFVTSVGRLGDLPAYLAALKHEIGVWRGQSVDTIFLGGGTPSMLTPAQMADLLGFVRETLDVSRDAETTVEANPGTLGAGDEVDLAKLAEYREAGVNRLSFGVQTFDVHGLRALGRIHSADDARRAVRLARDAGFDNINLDLIYGWPGQTLDIWRRDLEMALALRPDHLSAYSLIVEAGTPFARMGVQPPEPDLDADLYGAAVETLSAAGYPRYEISNFAKDGRACRHNLVYWRNGEYLGCGVSAASHVEGRRWSNPRSLDGYVARPLGRESQAEAWATAEHLTGSAKIAEALILGLRLAEGVELDADADETFGEALGDLEGWGLGARVASPASARRGDRFVLTDRGFSLANRVGVRILESVGCLAGHGVTVASPHDTLALVGGEC